MKPSTACCKYINSAHNPFPSIYDQDDRSNGVLWLQTCDISLCTIKGLDQVLWAGLDQGDRR